MTFVRGPEVRTQTVRTRLSEGPQTTLTELHRLGGTVRDGEDRPAANAWVALPDSGLWTATDGEGRFRLSRVHPGEHRLVVRTVSGDEAEATISLPGESVDLVVGAKPRGGAKARRAAPRD